MNPASSAVMFDKFRIVDTLKKDMYSGVYLAFHVYLNKEIILKTLDTESTQDSSILERFKREARILAQLDHPNIIKVLDFGTYDRFFYISFEYFNGSNLRETISAKSLSEESKCFILRQLFRGLGAAHEHEIIHRDLKPENILVNNNCEIKIADFGLAQSMREDMSTNKYGIVGTPGYMSPEQIRGEALTVQSDIFSAGIIALELYTGNNPFFGRDINETINNILKFRESLLEEKTKDLPEDIKKIISHLLQKSKNHRAKSASEVLQLFRPEEMKDIPDGKYNSSFATDKKGTLRAVYVTEEIPRPKRKHFYTGVAVFIVVVAIAVIVWGKYYELGKDDLLKPENQTALKSQTSGDSISIPLKKSGSPALNLNEPETKAVIDNKTALENKTPAENKIPSEKKLISENKSGLENKINQTGNPVDIKSAPVNAGDGKKPVTGGTTGKLVVLCQPWADVYIDSDKKDATPLNIELKEGLHSLVLKHPKYPPYTQEINISAENTTQVSINFETIVGYLTCDVRPWGKIFVDGKDYGSTPIIKKPIVLMPGKHILTVKNESFKDLTEEITIRKGETFSFKHSFNP